MFSNFRSLCILCSVGALLILAGFFLTMLPIIIQILLLIAGLVVCCMTFFNLIRHYKQFIK